MVEKSLSYLSHIPIEAKRLLVDMKDTGCRQPVHFNQSGCLVRPVGVGSFYSNNTEYDISDRCDKRAKQM
jgi:hypothetical protein